MEGGDSLLVKALPGRVVAVVTQATLVTRGFLDERKKRRFLRADLLAETRACLEILELFLASIDDERPEASTDLGVGLAIYIAPIRCREEYERFISTIKNALPVLTEKEFQNASELKRQFRLLVGYEEACDRYFKKLQEASLSEGVTEESLASRREVFMRYGREAKQNIVQSAKEIRDHAAVLIKCLTPNTMEDQTP